MTWGHKWGREERVRECMRLMCAGQWVTGETGDKLAAEWGMAATSVSEIAGEASRRVKYQVHDKATLRVYAITKLKKIAEKAEDADNPLTNRVAVAALSELLKFAMSSDAPEGWEQLTHAERWARLDDAQARLDSIREELGPREVLKLEP